MFDFYPGLQHYSVCILYFLPLVHIKKKFKVVLPMCEQNGMEWNFTYWDTEKWILSWYLQDWHSIWLLHGDLRVTGEITGDTVIIYGISQCHEQNDSTGIYGGRNWYNYYAKCTIIIIFSSMNRMEWRFVQLTTTEYHSIARWMQSLYKTHFVSCCSKYQATRTQ